MRARPMRLSRRPRPKLRERSHTGRGAAAFGQARARLRNFRQASMVAVATTGFLLLLLSPGGSGAAQGITAAPDTTGAARATAEATGTLLGLWRGFVGNLPKYLIAIAILAAAWVVTWFLRTALRRFLRGWERTSAIAALTGMAVWLLAVGIALSVLVGDIRALVGSLGLVGLALSWALQTPIESFTGWLLNSFHGYYRLGDRIAVGDVFGDVYRIDFLTTTVWEYGGPDRPPPSIQAEQPTGRLITFPNNEILTGTVVNYTRDFPYVWDELSMSVANESELGYAMDVARRVAEEVVGGQMEEPARQYEALLRRQGLEAEVAERPTVYASSGDWSTSLTVRYLVATREKRKWKSELTVRLTTEFNRPEHAGKILTVYPRNQVQFVNAAGEVVEPPAPSPPEPEA